MRFEVAVELANITRVWNLNAELRRILEPIAAEFGWSVEDFLTRYSRGALPAQVPGRVNDDEQPAAPEGFSAEGFDSEAEIWNRIQRAAEFVEDTPVDFIWKSVWGAVRCAEDDMIIAPSDGRTIGDVLKIRGFEMGE